MSTKFNGVSYIVQRAAEALYSPGGKQQVAALIKHYMGNAAILRDACKAADLEVFGGVNAPYIWVRTPAGVSSWDMFDMMLTEANIVVTPGSGFGSAGEGYFRISAFNARKPQSASKPGSLEEPLRHGIRDDSAQTAAHPARGSNT